VKLIVQGIECYYDSVKVLNNVSFTVSGGHFFGVIGPNGSGKTTLLRTISGVLRPKIGSVLIDNQEIHMLKRVEVAKKVGVVSQNPSSTLNFTVLDLVLMGRNPYLGRMENEDADDLSIAEWAMKLTNTLHLANRHIDELSGGERQRVIIARALAQRPKVLLLDEPTLHLDINHQLEIMELLRRLCSEQKLAVVAVLHDFNLAARYCDSLAIMSQGRITAIGPCEKVLTSRNIEKAFGVRMMIKRHPVTADIVLIADMPFGHLNLKNLEAALEAQKAVKRIVIVAGQPSRSRDYTGGRAKAILERLEEQGAIVVKNEKKAIKIVKSLEG
jgi:iron complex transport system ATP-binding protein